MPTNITLNRNIHFRLLLLVPPSGFGAYGLFCRRRNGSRKVML